MRRGYLVRHFTIVYCRCGLFLRLDLKGVDKMTFDFQLGQPFHPFEQLMGVLPAASRELVPQAYQVSFSNDRNHARLNLRICRI